MEIESIFEYEKLLEDAKKHFEDKEVDSLTVSAWLGSIGLAKYVQTSVFNKLMLKLRTDLWKAKGIM